MIATILGLVQANNMATIIAIVAAANFALSGVHKALESLKNKFADKWPEKADGIVVRVLSFLQGLLDWIAPRSAQTPPVDPA